MNCWALKTRETKKTVPHEQIFSGDLWQWFVRDKVIAIGWDLKGDPRELSDAEIISLFMEQEYTKGQAIHAKNAIRLFSDRIAKGDEVLLCRGYAANLGNKVHLYGIAKVTSDFYLDVYSDWWHYKRRAEIKRFGVHGVDIPKQLLKQAIRLGSMRQTIQRIPCDGLDNLLELVRTGKFE